MTTNAGASRSALYSGWVTHQRLRPQRHRLRYRVFSLLLDIDELPALAQRLRLFSLNRFNLFSLHERDYGDGSSPLREHVDRELRAAGLPAGGAVHLLTMPRILGYAFNPLNVYFCHAVDGGLRAILYEVNNTFGERHSYLIEVPGDGRRDGPIVQRCAKQLHVSPFMPLSGMHYDFRITAPRPASPRLHIGVEASDAGGSLLQAGFVARRQTLSDRALAKTLLTHPLLTLRVMAAIHWEALRLLAKGLRIIPKPAPPAHPITVVRNETP
jgi:DUF1365 family protein